MSIHKKTKTFFNIFLFRRICLYSQKIINNLKLKKHLESLQASKLKL